MDPSEPVRRRTVLASGTCLLAGLSGCSATFGESSDPETHHPPPVKGLVLWNHFDEHGSENRRYGTRIGDEESFECGRYEASVRSAERPRWATFDNRSLEPADVRDGKVKPVELDVEFGPDGFDFVADQIHTPLVECDETTTA